MVGLNQDYVFTAVPRDSILSLPNYQATNTNGASFDTPAGRCRVSYTCTWQCFVFSKNCSLAYRSPFFPFYCGFFQIKPAEYVEMVSSMKPDMWVTLADEVPAWVSEKRNKASIARTIRWLDDCIALNLATKTGGAVFGSIVGGSKIEERRLCAQEVAKRSVSGTYILISDDFLVTYVNNWQ